MLVKLIHCFPLAVQQEASTGFQILNHVIHIYIRRLMACDKICLRNIVGGLDRFVPETQMGNRQAAGFLGIVGEIALRVHIGVIADDLDGVLVRADGAVCAKAPELARVRAFGRRVGVFLNFERKVRNVIRNAYGKALLRRVGLHVAVNGNYLARVGVF